MTGVAVRAITFDYWNTIMFAADPVGRWRSDAWLELLSNAGLAVQPDDVSAAFRAAWAAHTEAWVANIRHTGVRFAEVAVAALPVAVGGVLRRDLIDAFMHEGDGEEFLPCPGVADALAALTEADVRIGIVCDVGITPSTGLRRLLERHDLLRHFDSWSFSDEVGWYKPAPEIFRHALDTLGVTATDAAHIGDIRRTDIAGARAMGMTAIRYRGVSDDTADDVEGDHVIDHHDQLPAVLGLS